MTISYAPGSYCVRHGGSWGGSPQGAQVANHSTGTIERRNFILGVRLVRRCT